jgi:hypothetical protein
MATRSNIVFVTLLLMLAGLAAGVALRRGGSQAAPLAAPTPEPSAAGSTPPPASGSASARLPPQPSASAAPAPGPKLDRPLRVVGLGWELCAAAVMANDGASPGPKSRFTKYGLTVELSAHHEVGQVENALARGGQDDEGADVAILPLQRFVASYERLKALSPVIFFVVGWSDGGEVLASKQESLEKLPAKGEVKLRATPGEPAAFLGMFAFDLAGVSPDRVVLTQDDDAPWAALSRRESKQKSEQTSGHLILSTGEASRLVPFVAVAQAALVEKHAPALVALAQGWLAGQEMLAGGAPEAARKIGEVKGAPEPLAVLSRLGEMRAASLAENAELAGLAGRGAVTLEALFRRSWQIWREAKVLTVAPETAPVDGTITAALVRAGGRLTPPASPARPKVTPRTQGKPLVTYRAAAGKLDEATLIETIGFVAGVFPRCPVRVTIHPQLAPDKKRTAELVQAVRERFDLGDGRLLAGEARGRGAAPATVEVMPIP